MPENLYTPNSLRTFGGLYIDLLDPQLESINASDIAIGLSRICRFGGHTRKFYSVAEHSDWCRLKAAELFPDDEHLPFKIFMHDAHEFILCDVPSPLKKLIPEYDHVAQKLQNVIHRRFGISLTNRDEERIALIDKMALEWEWENKVCTWKGVPLDDRASSEIFLHHFVKLCKVPHVL